MTIENIDYTTERKEAKRNKDEKTNEQIVYQKLITSFNKKAKEINSPYRILISYEYPHLYLIKKWLIFEDKEKINQIYYSKEKNTFSFIYGLDEKTFKAIEIILNKLEIKFDIELKSGKIPTKYKIIKNL